MPSMIAPQSSRARRGAAETDAPVADNRGAVADAEAQLEDTDLAEDRETPKRLQQDS